MARRLPLSIAIVGFAVTTATVIFAWEDDALLQQAPAACVPPGFGDPPIVRPIDRATTGAIWMARQPRVIPLKQPNNPHRTS